MLKKVVNRLRRPNRYRSFVGPESLYDLNGAMVFNLLTCVGLRQQHKVLDIGCGSLRSGRLLIPYLDPGNYVGVEPNRWLVQEGIRREIGRDLVRLKRPTFSYRADLREIDPMQKFDFAVAQSIFSHAGKDILDGWLTETSRHLKNDGALFATFLLGERDYEDNGWVYPGTVSYRAETLHTAASHAGLSFEVIDWEHPGQIWGVFAKPDHDRSLLDGGNISWKRAVARARQVYGMQHAPPADSQPR